MAPILYDLPWKNAIPTPAEFRDPDGPELRGLLQKGDARPISDIQDDPESILELMKLKGQASTGDARIEITMRAQNRDLFLGTTVDEQDVYWDGVHHVRYWENMR
jgi:hypothetical protein